MGENHFKYFRLKNFKRFTDLEVKDIGQFNLVLGDNNVGKTSLLEGLMYDPLIRSLIFQYLKDRILKLRIGTNVTGGFWQHFVNKNAFLANEEIHTEIIVNDGKNSDSKWEDLELNFNKHTKQLKFGDDLSNLHSHNNHIENGPELYVPNDLFSPFISNLEGHDWKLTQLYSKVIQTQTSKEKKAFIKQLKVIDESIEDLELENITSEHPMITIDSSKYEGRNILASYGEGTISIFRIFLYLQLFKGKRLMIDEIDAGIHYSRMKDFWKVVLQAAKENDVQLFASTHNRECIEYFEEAVQELGDEYKSDARTITLKEHPVTKDVTAYTNYFEVLQDVVEAGNDLR